MTSEGLFPRPSEFALSCFQARSRGAPSSELNHKLGLLPAPHWLHRKPGGAAVRNSSAPSARDPLVREKVFLCDIYAHSAAPAPRASFVPVEADFALVVLGSDSNVRSQQEEEGWRQQRGRSMPKSSASPWRTEGRVPVTNALFVGRFNSI